MKYVLLAFILFSLCSKTMAQDNKKAAEFINNSSIAFTIEEKDLLPENIAYDPVKRNFYVGSTRKGKILRITEKGKKEEFINARANGLWMVIGMKVDSKRKVLWACSSGGNNLIGYDRDDKSNGRPAGVFKFDLKTGKLIKKYVLDNKNEVHFFNDLTISNNGDVYITHMFNDAAIYRIKNGEEKMEIYFQDEKLKYPNGITLSTDNKFLFFAYSGGIGRIDINTKKWITLQTPTALNLTKNDGIDGLYFIDNKLVTVHSFSKKIQKITLDNNLEKITSHKLMEYNHPMMNRPTTGVLKGNDFYYIANSQFDSFKEGKLFPENQLYEVAVLKLKIQ